VGVLAACGSDSAEPSGSTGSATGEPPLPFGSADRSEGSQSEAAEAGAFTIVQRFPQQVAVPGVVRLPISLSTGSADLIQDGPAVLDAQVVDIDRVAVGEPISAVRRDAEPAPYWAFTPTIDAAGVYYLVVDGGPPDGAAFQVFDRDDVPVPSPGDTLEPFDTPTTDDPREVDPICTRQPEPCPFHDITLTEALASGKNVAYYVGTPAYCSTGSCAPGLESLIEVADEMGDQFSVIHAEVYTDDTAKQTTAAVQMLGLFYEPTLILTDPSGTIVERLDSTWNTEELREAMQRVAT
jgi:hypothetical protein